MLNWLKVKNGKTGFILKVNCCYQPWSGVISATPKMKQRLFYYATKEGFKNWIRILAVSTRFGVMRVIPELRCGKD